jgi:excisionase family DNA binding protein
MNAEPLPQLLDIATLAERLATNPRHIRRLIQERRIPFIKVGRLVRFDPAEIAHWLNTNRRALGSSDTHVMRVSAPVRSLQRRRPAQAVPPRLDRSSEQLSLEP